MPEIDDLQHDDLRDEIKRVLQSCRGSKPVAAAITSAETRLAVVGSLMRIMGKTPPEAIDDERLEKTIVLAGMALNRMPDHGPRLAEMTELVARAVESCRAGARSRLEETSATSPSEPGETAKISAPVADREKRHETSDVKGPHARPETATRSATSVQTPAPAKTRPSAATRLSPLDDVYGTVPIRLFPDVRPERGRLAIPELLTPPPPRDGERKPISDWVSGKPWNPDVFVFRLHPRDDVLAEEMAEFEAEMHAAAKVVLARRGVRRQLDEDTGARDKEWLHGVARDMGVYAMTTHRVARHFADALARVLQRHHPDHVPALAAFDAHVVLGDDLYFTLSEAWDIEHFFLSETGSLEGNPQNLMGSIHPDGELREGICFERGIFMHLNLGKPLGSALREAVTELRFAQVIRGLPREEEAAAIAGFDKVFSRDCTDPLEAYRMNPEKNEPTSLDAPGY
jgi:hypothetical protein